jgi:hypothetical protein
MAASAGTVTLELDANSVKLLRGLLQSERASRRTVGSITRDFERMGKRIGLSVAAIATGVTLAVRQQARAIDELAKTADALGVVPERLQALQHVAELTGSSAQQLATNMERMQRRLGEVARGGGTAKKALEEIGVSINDLVNLSADEQMERLATALAGVENATLRASIANDLFGRDGVRMLKLMDQLAKDGIGGVVKELQQLGVAVSRSEAAGVERMNDALTKARIASKGAAQQFTIGLAPAVAAIAEQFTDAAKSSGGFGSAMLNLAEITAKSVGFIGDMVRGLNVTIRLFTAGIASLMAETVGQLALVERAAVRAGNRVANIFGREGYDPSKMALSQIEEALRLRAGELAQNASDLVMQMMPSDEIAARIQAIRADLEEISSGGAGGFEIEVGVTADISAAEKALADLRAQVATFGLSDLDRQMYGLANLEGMTPQQLEDARQMVQWLHDANEAADTHKKLQEDIAAAIRSAQTPAEKYVATIERLNELSDGGLDPETYTRLVIAAQEELVRATEVVEETFDIWQAAADQAARNIQSSLAQFLFDPFKDGLKGMLRGFVDTLRRMAAEAAAAQILGSVFGGQGGLGGFLGGLFGGPRASGGPVSSNKAYLVGERGPELFMPSSSGNIVPNHAMGGSVVVNIDARQSDDPGRLLALVPVIQNQIEQGMALKMRRGYL